MQGKQLFQNVLFPLAKGVPLLKGVRYRSCKTVKLDEKCTRYTHPLTWQLWYRQFFHFCKLYVVMLHPDDSSESQQPVFHGFFHLNSWKFNKNYLKIIVKYLTISIPSFIYIGQQKQETETCFVCVYFSIQQHYL